MKYAICNELFEGWPWERVCRYAARIGYSGLEIAPFTLGPAPIELGRAERARMAGVAEEVGVEIVGLHWLLAKTSGFHLTSPDRSTRDQTADYLLKLAVLCRDLGGQLLVLGSPQQRNFPEPHTHQRAVEWAADALQRIAPELADLNVVLAIEPLSPHETNFLQTAAAARELIERIDSPQVQLHLDVRAMSTEELPIPEIIRRNRDCLAHFHANDPNRLGPGMGDVDYAEIALALHEIDYRGWISVEVFDFSPGPETIATSSIEYLSRLLGPSEIR